MVDKRMQLRTNMLTTCLYTSTYTYGMIARNYDKKGTTRMKRSSKRLDIHQQIAEFEQNNPKIAEAMRLFNITMDKYQGALHALRGPRVYTSDSTAPKDRQQSG